MTKPYLNHLNDDCSIAGSQQLFSQNLKNKDSKHINLNTSYFVETIKQWWNKHAQSLDICFYGIHLMEMFEFVTFDMKPTSLVRHYVNRNLEGGSIGFLNISECNNNYSL